MKLLFCNFCGNELATDNADVCTKCGKVVVKKLQESEDHKPTCNPSKAWYLIPIFFGIIGGLIMYFVLRKEDKGMAQNCLIIGITISAIGLIVGFVSVASLGMSHYR